jgi:hypothetical protein
MPIPIENRRRRSTRDPSTRPAEYTIAGSDHQWRSCQLVDASLMGIGVDFIETPPPSAAVGRTITLRLLNTAGAPIGIEFSGVIRNISPGRETLRVGLEFAELETQTRAALELLVQRHFV